MNNVIMSGNIGKGGAIVRESRGVRFGSFSIANDVASKDADGDWTSTPHWFRCVCFGKLVDRLAKLGEGDRVLIRGSLRQSVYEKDGVKTSSCEIHVFEIETLRRKAARMAEEAGEEPDAATQGEDHEEPIEGAEVCEPGTSPAQPSRRRR